MGIKKNKKTCLEQEAKKIKMTSGKTAEYKVTIPTPDANVAKAGLRLVIRVDWEKNEYRMYKIGIKYGVFNNLYSS